MATGQEAGYDELEAALLEELQRATDAVLGAEWDVADEHIGKAKELVSEVVNR